MPRKYNPEIETRCYSQFEPEFSEAVMKESQRGEWVKLTTFVDEQKRLQQQIARLTVQISTLHNQIGSAGAGLQVHETPPEQSAN